MAETIIQRLARTCHTQTAPLRGKKRDEATAAFWVGAWSALVEVDHDAAAWVGRVTQLLILTRGFAEVERIVREADAAKAAPAETEARA